MVNKPRDGFTLMELMVVLLIIGLLAGLVAPQIIGRVSDARVTTANAQIAMLGVALENYKLDIGSYPTTEQGLPALRTRPATPPTPTNWRGPYLKKDVPHDPWGRAYIYRTPAKDDSTGFELETLGRDGRAGGTGEDKDLSGG